MDPLDGEQDVRAAGRFRLDTAADEVEGVEQRDLRGIEPGAVAHGRAPPRAGAVTRRP